MAIVRKTCYQCQGRGYKYITRMFGLVLMPIKENCTTCNGKGYREVRE